MSHNSRYFSTTNIQIKVTQSYLKSSSELLKYFLDLSNFYGYWPFGIYVYVLIRFVGFQIINKYVVGNLAEKIMEKAC